jgi:hypothetical protein
MNRSLLGICALVLLLLGGAALLYDSGDGTTVSFAAGCLRVGLVLGAIWLALPQITSILSRMPRWMMVALAIGLVVIIIRPWYALIVVPVLVVLWMLGPRLATKADPTIVRRRFKKRPPAARE